MRVSLVSKEKYKELELIRDSFQVVESGDICIAVGGDGTFVRAAETHDCPILPIRSDTETSTGYYADVGLDQIDKVIRLLKKGSYTVETAAHKLELVYKGRKHYAVNEVRLNNEMEEVSFRVYDTSRKNREKIYPYAISGDGLIITSAVGSTAYNRSAGGPIILTPNVLCLTLLNVDGPYKNPIVIDNGIEFEVEVVKYNGRLRYDSSDAGILKPGNRFAVRLSEKTVKVVRLEGMRETFAGKMDRVIRSKMFT